MIPPELRITVWALTKFVVLAVLVSVPFMVKVGKVDVLVPFPVMVPDET
jgi:hypothetical protein